MDGDTYERWVAGVDLETGEPRGRLRTDARAVRFVEVVVNGPKSWSLAAAVHPEIAAAYDAAQARAATEIIGWLAQRKPVDIQAGSPAITSVLTSSAIAPTPAAGTLERLGAAD